MRVNGLLGGDSHVYFVASGSEANEAAFKTRPEIDRSVDVLDHAIAEAGKGTRSELTRTRVISASGFHT